MAAQSSLVVFSKGFYNVLTSFTDTRQTEQRRWEKRVDGVVDNLRLTRGGAKHQTSLALLK